MTRQYAILILAILSTTLACDSDDRPAPGQTPAPDHAITATQQSTAQPAESTPAVATTESPEPSSDTTNLTPTETIHRLRKFRTDARYSKIEPHLQPVQASVVLDLLRATDRLNLATLLLHRRVTEHMGTAAGQRFNYDQTANLVGIFSRDVTLLTEKIDDDHATLSYQIAGHVPLETAEFVRKNDRWILSTDPVAGVPEQILELAFIIERISANLNKTQYTPDELQREITLRQSPVMRRLKKILAEHADKQDQST